MRVKELPVAFRHGSRVLLATTLVFSLARCGQESRDYTGGDHAGGDHAAAGEDTGPSKGGSNAAGASTGGTGNVPIAGEGGETAETGGTSSNAGTGGSGNVSGSSSNGEGGGAGAGEVDAPPHPIQIGIGNTRMCALISDGHIYCWGYAWLGNGTRDSEGSATPVLVSDIDNAVQLAIGASTSCALLADHTIKCWGADDMGQISANATSSDGYDKPVNVGGLTSVKDVVNGSWTLCALVSNGTVRCWGSSDGGGAGTEVAVKTMSGISGATSLGGNLCAVLSDKSIDCWQGADGTPAARSGLPKNITQVAGTCALSSDGSVRCWGPGGQGQIGNGQTDDQTDPQLVEQLGGAATWIGAGNHHVCAILEDQSFSCWGKDGFFDPIDYGPVPLPIDGVGKVVAAAANLDNTCVIETDNTVKCWGSNLSGMQLGENGPDGNSATPVVITGLPGTD